MNPNLQKAIRALLASGHSQEALRRPVAALAALLLLGRQAETRELAILRTGASNESAACAFDEPVRIPAIARRKALTRTRKDHAAMLLKVADALEQANPDLLELCSDLRKLTSLTDTVLDALISNLNHELIRDERPPSVVLLALVDQLTDAHSGAWTASPPPLRKLLLDLASIDSGMRVADLYARTGELLVPILQDIADRQLAGVHVVAQEQSRDHVVLLGYLALLTGTAFAVNAGEPLCSPLVDANQDLLRFERLISILPFGQRLTREQLSHLERDPHRRFRYGGLHTNTRSLAFAQHCVAALAPEGRAVILVEGGVLVRGKTERDIRQALIEDDVLEAIITVPIGTLSYTGIQTAVLVVTPNKPAERRGTTLMISLKGERPKGRVILTDAEVDRALHAYNAWQSEDGYARLVTIGEMRQEDYVLHPSRFIDDFAPPERRDPIEMGAQLEQLEARRDALARQMDELLHEINCSSDEDLECSMLDAEDHGASHAQHPTNREA